MLVGRAYVFHGKWSAFVHPAAEPEKAYLQDADHLSGAGYLAADLSALHRRDQSCSGFGIWKK